MKILDRFAARWRARQDRKLLRGAGVQPEGPVSRTKPWKRQTRPSGPSNRAMRRLDLQHAGPLARQHRLDTHMRRPLVAVACHGDHHDDHPRDRRRKRREQVVDDVRRLVDDLEHRATHTQARRSKIPKEVRDSGVRSSAREAHTQK